MSAKAEQEGLSTTPLKAAAIRPRRDNK